MKSSSPDVISKAQLSRDLRISAPRVSQYVRSGLPVRPDGKLKRTEVLKWLAFYRTSGRDRSKGPALATSLLDYGKPAVPKALGIAPSTNDDARLLQTLARVVSRCGEVAARGIIASGGSLALAYATASFVMLHIGEVAEKAARKAGCRPPGDWPESSYVNLDWTALAGRPVEQTELNALDDNLCDLAWHQALGADKEG